MCQFIEDWFGTSTVYTLVIFTVKFAVNINCLLHMVVIYRSGTSPSVQCEIHVLMVYLNFHKSCRVLDY
jgi:hypothetical protein